MSPREEITIHGFEWGQFLEWKCEESLEWRDLGDDMNAKMHHFTSQLNQLYTKKIVFYGRTT